MRVQSWHRSPARPFPPFELTDSAPLGTMARWPRHAWTSIFTYAVILILFPILCYLAYAWVRGEWVGLNHFFSGPATGID
jgi:hypothetical protein